MNSVRENGEIVVGKARQKPGGDMVFKPIAVLACAFVITQVAIAQSIFGPGRRNELPAGDTVPHQSRLPYDTTRQYHLPAIELSAKATGGGLFSGSSGTAVAGVGVVVLLEAGAAGLLIEGNYAGSSDSGVFAYAEGSLAYRNRMFRVDPNGVLWGGWGVDVKGRGRSQKIKNIIDSYLRIQPVALFGTMFAVEEKGRLFCQVQLFAKAGLGVFDNEGQSNDHWSWPGAEHTFENWLKPMAGAEALALCGANVRIHADYQHIFSLLSGRDTDRASAEFSKTWNLPGLTKDFRLGFFLRGEHVSEQKLGTEAGSFDETPASEDLRFSRFFGGVIAHF